MSNNQKGNGKGQNEKGKNNSRSRKIIHLVENNNKKNTQRQGKAVI